MMIWQDWNMSECLMWNYMCIRWLINWSDSTKMHGATIRFIHNPVGTSPLPHACHMPRPSHYSVFDHQNNIPWVVQTTKLTASCLLHFPVTSSLLGPNIFPSTQFSNTLSQRSSISPLKLCTWNLIRWEIVAYYTLRKKWCMLTNYRTRNTAT